MSLSRRLERLEAMRGPSRGLELFVQTVGAMRARDTAELAALRAELASIPEGQDNLTDLARGFLAVAGEA